MLVSLRVVTVKSCGVSYHDAERDDPAEDDSSSDHGANSTTESEDEEELDGIVLRKSLVSARKCPPAPAASGNFNKISS